jgi:hypothetical protein
MKTILLTAYAASVATMLLMGTAANAGVIDWISKNIFGGGTKSAFERGLPSPAPRSGGYYYDRYGNPVWIAPQGGGDFTAPDGAKYDNGPK